MALPRPDYFNVGMLNAIKPPDPIKMKVINKPHRPSRIAEAAALNNIHIKTIVNHFSFIKIPA